MDCEITTNSLYPAVPSAPATFDEPLVSVKATFVNTTIRFCGKCENYETLCKELKLKFPEFIGDIFYLDDEGDFVAISSDEELEHALTISSSPLRLILSNVGAWHVTKLYLGRFLKKREACKLQHVVVSLINQGFSRKEIKNNFELIQSLKGDLPKTIEALQELPTHNKRKFVGCDNSASLDWPDDLSNKRQKLEEKWKHKEEKMKGKFQKHEEKMKRKEDKAFRKVEKTEDKSSKREEKLLKNAEKKYWKETQDNGRKELRTINSPTDAFFCDVGQAKLATDFKQLALSVESAEQKIRNKQCSILFLDGDNMLDMTDMLRKLTIKGKRATAEKMLAAAALTFSNIFGVSTEVVFDTVGEPEPSSRNVSKIPAFGIPTVLLSGNTFLVSSAAPNYRSTDDKLLSCARLNLRASPSSLVKPNSSVVVVSSDRALADELASLGVTICRPSDWIRLFASAVKAQENDHSALGTDFNEMQWLDQWCLEFFAD